MKTITLMMLLLTGITISCSKSSTDPTPPTPVAGPCSYKLSYSLRYSPLSTTKPTTITYLDSNQQEKSVTLTDTSFNMTINYQYGDNVYVKFNQPYFYFQNKSGNKFFFNNSFKRMAISCAGTAFVDSGGARVILRDSFPSFLFDKSPFRAGY